MSATARGLSRQPVSPHLTVIYLGVTVGTVTYFLCNLKAQTRAQSTEAI